ncbi:MAG: RNA polymerase sigma-70 factor [Odoribacter sp.]|nr:RNA polymerase sigma-70 factor [Odoribacter sp.]
MGENKASYSDSEFEAVFKSHYRALFLFAYGYVVDEMEAEDIVSGVFSLLWEKRKNLPPEEELKPYLYASVKYACLRYFKRLQLTDDYRKRQAEAFILSFAEEKNENELTFLVKKALECLSDNQRKIVEMHVMKGMKYAEISEAMNISENTIRTHLKRAYKVLRFYLKDTLPGIFF